MEGEKDGTVRAVERGEFMAGSVRTGLLGVHINSPSRRPHDGHRPPGRSEPALQRPLAAHWPPSALGTRKASERPELSSSNEIRGRAARLISGSDRVHIMPVSDKASA